MIREQIFAELGYTAKKKIFFKYVMGKQNETNG